MTLQPTGELRYLSTTIAMCDGPGGDYTKNVLQQAFISDSGDLVWKSVPVLQVTNEQWEKMNDQRIKAIL